MKKLSFLLASLLPISAFAHGGHGHWDPHSLLHYIGTPEHALPLLAIAVVGVYFYRRRLKASTR